MGKYFIFSILICCLFTSSYSSSTLASENETSEELSPRLFRYDIIIDVGHGGIDGGTSYGALLEKDLNLAIGVKLFKHLKAQGYQVGITRLTDYALSDDSTYTWMKSRHKRDLTQRWLIAEGLKPKVFISIHVNFSPHRYNKGAVILHQKQAESYLLAELIQKELNELTQTHDRQKMTQYYYLLKTINQPSLIAEVGYISHPHEREKLQNEGYQQELAEKMSNAIDQFFLLYP